MNAINSVLITKNKYITQIDGLRTIAVLLVLFFHIFPEYILSGYIGVDIFFVISGYLITMNLLKSDQEIWTLLQNFYRRRILRLIPSLAITMILIYWLSSAIMIPTEWNEFKLHFIFTSLFIENIKLYFESGYFDTSSNYKPLLNMWSLGVEEQFYLSWPILLLLFFRILKNIILFTIILLSFIAYILNFYYYPEFAFYMLFTRLWEFGIGSLAYIYKDKFNKYFGGNYYDFPLLLTILFIAIFKGDVQPWLDLLLLVTTLFATIKLINSNNSNLTILILSNRFSQFFGNISYILYLIHWPIISLLWIIYGERPPLHILLGTVIFDIIYSYLIWRFIEFKVRSSALFIKYAYIILILFLITNLILFYV